MTRRNYASCKKAKWCAFLKWRGILEDFVSQCSTYICRSAGHCPSKKPFKGLTNHVNIDACEVTSSTPPIISHIVGQVTFIFRERIPNNSYCSSHCQALTLSSISIEMLLSPKTRIFAVKKMKSTLIRSHGRWNVFQNCLGLVVGGFAMYINAYFICIYPSVCFMKQCSSFHANLTLFFS